MSSQAPGTERELWEKLLAAFADSEPETSDEVNAELREFGVDPEEVSDRLMARAKAALARSPDDWRQRSRAARQAQLVKRARQRELEGLSIESLRGLVRQKMADGHTAAHFRNLEDASAADLAQLLADIEFLDEDE